MKAKSVAHAEWEILNEIMNNIDFESLRDRLVTDEHSKKRFDTAGENICSLIERMMQTREKNLPKGHEVL